MTQFQITSHFPLMLFYIVIAAMQVASDDMPWEDTLNPITSYDANRCNTQTFLKEGSSTCVNRICVRDDSTSYILNSVTTLHHPNIIHGALRDTFTNEVEYDHMETCYYVEMPYYNRHLDDFIKQSFPTPIQDVIAFENLIREMSRDILSALAYLHAYHIAHMDIQGRNIKKVGNRYILDHFEYSTNQNIVRGSFGTLKSPEMLIRVLYLGVDYESQKPYDPKKSDLYSFGIMVAQYATGTSLNDLTCTKDIFENTTFSKTFIEFIDKLVKCEPEERMTAEEALKHSFLVSKSRNRGKRTSRKRKPNSKLI
eukprot:NODE_819_length_3714_cov_0.260304.p2 type:complete len:311 gc:universal NODE_819_length_3714_cov_0.260304:891-1823(+)